MRSLYLPGRSARSTYLTLYAFYTPCMFYFFLTRHTLGAIHSPHTLHPLHVRFTFR